MIQYPEHLVSQLGEAVEIIRYELSRPSLQMRPKVYLDGNQWGALYGENLQEGVCAFGDSPDAAMHAFDVAWAQPIKESETK